MDKHLYEKQLLEQRKREEERERREYWDKQKQKSDEEFQNAKPWIAAGSVVLATAISAWLFKDRSNERPRLSELRRKRFPTKEEIEADKASRRGCIIKLVIAFLVSWAFSALTGDGESMIASEPLPSETVTSVNRTILWVAHNQLTGEGKTTAENVARTASARYSSITEIDVSRLFRKLYENTSLLNRRFSLNEFAYEYSFKSDYVSKSEFLVAGMATLE